MQRELGWRPQTNFDVGMEKTIAWYLEHRGWVENVRSGAYREYYDLHYGDGLHLVQKAA